MDPAIELKAVTKRYRGLAALEALSLCVRPGEILGLLGDNGAGKTTTIKLILGLVTPDAGELSVLGQHPGSKAAHGLRLRIGYLPESLRFYDKLTGREVLDYFSRLKRVAARERDRLLEQVGLTGAADRPVATWSKGMRQRLGLAQAFLGSPRLLLLDEPSTGLDPIATQELLEQLRARRRDGCTILVSTHQLAGIEQHVDRVAILRRGRLQVLGSLEELRHRSGLPYRVRAWGRWPEAGLEQRLAGWGYHEFRLDGELLELTTTAENKLSLLHHLLKQPELKDLELEAPNLEALYRHYNQPSGQADA